MIEKIHGITESSKKIVDIVEVIEGMQRNMALVGEVSAAVTALEEQGTHLRGAVAAFRVLAQPCALRPAQAGRAAASQGEALDPVLSGAPASSANYHGCGEARTGF